MGIVTRLQRGWNAFVNNKDPTYVYRNIGSSYSYSPNRPRFSRGNERSIVTAIYNRIALDAAAMDIEHVNLDKEGRYLETRDSGLNTCLTLQANVDQTGRAFKQDMFMSIIDEGVIAVVPIDTIGDPTNSSSFDIESMRVGKITQWYPQHVKIRVYNDRTGEKEDIIMPKRSVAIIENPFYAVMNEPSSTMQRLVRKLNLLDAIDEQSGSGKLDLIIQLPYVIKSEARRQQAEERRQQIEQQLSGSKYGIAYADGTERITQLNRSLENNLLKQIEYLTAMLYSQLGITQEIMDGSASETTMLNYNNRVIEPLVTAAVDAMRCSFLSKTARTQGQSIMSFRDPFKLITAKDFAELTDKLTRNEVAAANEMRQVIGWKPSKDPKADELRNSNIRNPEEVTKTPVTEKEPKEENQNGIV